MNYFKTERNAVYEAGKIFTEYGWYFREQPIIDLGVDALVETPINENGQIKIFALQIKGGEINFQRNSKYLTFYFSQRHYLYWNAVSKNYSLFIILQDPITKRIFWQLYLKKFIFKTSKNWKIEIPTDNILNTNAKKTILNILNQHSELKFSAISNSVQNLFTPKKDLLTIYYYLDTEASKTMNICIAYKNQTTLINTGYKPKRKEWDLNKSFLSWDNVYYYSLIDFEKYIKAQFDGRIKSLKSFKNLIDEIRSITNDNIENIAEFIFNKNNEGTNVPKYKGFLEAFEIYSGLKPNQYESLALDSVIHFKTKKSTYEISTYESLALQLESYVENESYDEIYTQTDESIWGEIYIDAGIEKSKFIPIMQSELEKYWRKLYKRIEEKIGHTDHLNKSKEESWRMFETFIKLYNETENIIELAYDFDEMILYPIAVFTMLKIFDAEICYDEYCELEFHDRNDWESISKNEDDLESDIFFIRRTEE